MSTSNKKKFILNTLSVDIGCSSCRKPNLSAIFRPLTKLKKPIKTPITASSSSTTTTAITTATSFTATSDYQWESSDTSSPKSRTCVHVGGESVAVEKDSEDPYLDFRQSMLQMILENEIYSKQGLRDLLKCFLQLNAPFHHGIIVRAFTEIWEGVFSGAAGRYGGECVTSSADVYY